ncbi:ABC transporter ATP-binding protein [bacterium]|nr:ABC transporter ATP-binding protein [bacterium]
MPAPTPAAARPTPPKRPPGVSADALKALKRPLGYLGKHWREATGAAISLLIVLGASLATPQLIRAAIDDGLIPHRPQAIAFAVGSMVALAVLRAAFGFLQEYLTERASQGVAYQLREDLFEKIQRLSFSYYDRTEAGQLLTRLTSDVEQIRGFTGAGILQLANAGLMLVASVVLLFSLNWKLTLVTLLTLSPMFWLMANFVRRIGPLFGRIQHQLGTLNTQLQESLGGLRIVRAYGREADTLSRYRTTNEGLLDLSLASIRAVANNFPFIMMLANLATLAIIGFGGYQTIQGSLTVGQLLAFNNYLAFLMHPIMTLGFSMVMIARAGASAVRVAEIFDAPLEVADAPEARELLPLRGEVVFENVAFRYPGAERGSLEGLSFKVQPGETVAIVGTTGSGKSTLVHLLPRFYDVTAGRVLIDGEDLREVKLASLRSQLGVVMQAPLLFSGTIAQNIAYGKPDATQEAIEAAARAAQADAFIRELPDGYQTVIGERGTGLSGGQRQRLAIARALLVDPRLVILDDSTSAVDAETEAAIRESLDRLMRDARRTCFVIAQRFSTVRDADRILVLDGGKLVAEGTHEALLAECTLYAEILGAQFLDETPQTQQAAGGRA